MQLLKVWGVVMPLRPFFLNQYLSRGIQFSTASLNGALTQHERVTLKH